MTYFARLYLFHANVFLLNSNAVSKDLLSCQLKTATSKLHGQEQFLYHCSSPTTKRQVNSHIRFE